jgi:2-C-methyl-D-erythritol 4-phosphate cytidylyltransferase / 2-C-methyl-D-erythritol 2,4-cyclodiphosphate synthase
MKTSVIIVAAGEGSRFGGSKALVTLAGVSLFDRCLQVVREFGADEVIVVCREEDREALMELACDTAVVFVVGGEHRFESVRLGFEACSGDIVFIHNVANPLASVADFSVLSSALDESDMAFVGHRVMDTLRRVSADEHVRTFDRTDVWRAQTPQAFKREALQAVYKSDKHLGCSDEIQACESIGFKPVVFETGIENMKVTTGADLDFLERLFAAETLVGIGEDSHKFGDFPQDSSVAGTATSPRTPLSGKTGHLPLSGEKLNVTKQAESDYLVLGGVHIEALPPLEGNSDADVMLHALFNAVSGALGHGSLGNVADKMVEAGQRDSSAFLTVPFEWMEKRGFRIGNVAFSLECSKPKIDILVPELKASLSSICKLDASKIGITATSGEGLTAFGKGEGIRCSAAVSLVRV